jgi:hypothetical protein
MHQTYNGMAATQLPGARWQKSRYSGSVGNCVEMAWLPSGQVAVRNSRYPDGPALIYTRAEIEALIQGIKDGEFDNLICTTDGAPVLEETAIESLSTFRTPKKIGRNFNGSEPVDPVLLDLLEFVRITRS